MTATTETTHEATFTAALQTDPLAAVADYYASCLSEQRRALEFIADEFRIDVEQAIKQRFGFADRSLGKQIPSRRIKTGREIRDQLVSLGLYKANGRETLRGRVTQPIVDNDGNVIGIRGYKIDPHGTGEAVIVVGTLEAGSQEQEGKQEVTTTKLTNDTKQKQEATQEVTNNNNDDNLTIEDGQITFVRDDRRYRIRGLEKNKSTCVLKVSIMVSRDSLVHLDSLDLVKARSRASFIKAVATELYVEADDIKKDIGSLLLQLEMLQAERIAELKTPARTEVKLSDAEESSALELLRDSNLLQRIVADMDACGMVGEATNKLAGYLAATSRMLDKPLAVVIQSSSSAGKTSLMDSILAMMPAEDVQRFSGMTGQSLFYLDSDQIKHKILAIAEDEGIKQATYSLKLLQSEGELRHATVGRGEDGRSQTQEHHVEGPVQIFLTTTAMEIDEELVNRCLVLTVDESRNQTDAIQSLQRDARTSMVLQSRQLQTNLRSLHQNAQRLIRPLTVFNPYAPQLTFASDKTRLRRDHDKYLTLIETIALLHQHQRKIQATTLDGEQTEFINVERSDIAVANGIAGEVLGRSLDELSPQTRNLLMKLHEFVGDLLKQQDLPRSAVRFTRRQLRQSILWSDFQVRSHLKKLVEMEYVLVHRGRGGQRYVYELLYSGEGREGQPFMMGLIDPAKLKEPSSANAPMPKPRASLARPRVSNSEA